jgi:hypothetical protein
MLRTFVVGACAAALFLSVSLAMAQDKQQKDQPKDQPKVSDGERQAAQKINAAQGPDAKLKAAVEYLKKNSKGGLRPQVAENIANEIGMVNDPGQRLSLIGEYNKAFNQPAEADLIKPTMIEALSRQNKFEEVVAEGGKYLEKNPEDVVVLTLVAYAGANLTQKNPSNAAAVQTATKTGAKAVELMEADKKPEKMNAEYWNNFRNSWLPRLYQAQGVVHFFTNNKPAAKESLEKSMGLDPYDANTLMMLSNIQSDEYQALATKYQTEKKSALLDQALARMDELVDTLARAAAAMEGDARYQQMQPQVMEQLKQYYSFRHDNKTDGLKELIEKYKKKP